VLFAAFHTYGRVEPAAAGGIDSESQSYRTGESHAAIHEKRHVRFDTPLFDGDDGRYTFLQFEVAELTGPESK
jgi:hypothetical protein